MSEHEVSRPVNGQVYRDHFDAIDWDKKPGWDSEGSYFSEGHYYDKAPLNEPNKVLHWNNDTMRYE